MMNYHYPSAYQIRRIRQCIDEGITDKWDIEEIINHPNCPEDSLVIIDFIEMEINIYLKEKKNERTNK